MRGVKQMLDMKRVLIIEDRQVPNGEFHIGGPAVLPIDTTDDELTFASTAQLVRVNPGTVVDVERRLRAIEPDLHIRRAPVKARG